MTRQQASERSGRTPVCKVALAGLVALAAVGLPGCGGDSGTGGAIMSVSMTLTPDPVTSVVSAAGYEWVAPYQITLEESGGLGGTITNINVYTYENDEGVQGPEAADSDTLLEIPNTYLAANGTLEMTFNTHYTLANGQKAAFVDVFVYFIDDDGFNAQVGKRLTVQ